MVKSFILRRTFRKLHFLMFFGRCWGTFGGGLGEVWGHLRDMLGKFLACLDDTFGTCLEGFAIILDRRFGHVCETLGRI